MPRPNYLTLLQFGENWLRWGYLSVESLEALGREFEASDDKNAEHYRYRAFREFLACRRPLSPEMAEALYRLGDEDPDLSMGGTMMADIVALPECPVSVRERAASSGRPHLVSLARRSGLLDELNHGLTAELFERCLQWGDSAVHRALVERPELSRLQLERLAEAGANKSVRRLAAVRIRSGHSKE